MKYSDSQELPKLKPDALVCACRFKATVWGNWRASDYLGPNVGRNKRNELRRSGFWHRRR
jgi:hypothetical protein